MLNEQQVILSKVRLQSANDDYIVAQSLLCGGYYKVANNRAYYTMFHAIRAVLALEDKDFKKHAQVIGYFNKEYINTGYFDPHYKDMIVTASKSRTGSDYMDYYVATKEEAGENVSNAKLFLEAVENYVAWRMKNEYAETVSLTPELENEDEDEWER